MMPITYIDENFAQNSNNKLIFNKAGTYRLIGTVSHSPLHDSYTSVLYPFFNEKNITDDNGKTVSAINNYLYYTIINTTIEAKINDTLYITLYSDGNKNGISGGTLVVIKE